MPLCPQLPKTASNKQVDSGEGDQVSPSLTTAMLSDDSVSPIIERSLYKLMSRLVGELFECRQLKKMGMERWRCDRQSLTRMAELRGGKMKGGEVPWTGMRLLNFGENKVCSKCGGGTIETEKPHFICGSMEQPLSLCKATVEQR